MITIAVCMRCGLKFEGDECPRCDVAEMVAESGPGDPMLLRPSNGTDTEACADCKGKIPAGEKLWADGHGAILCVPCAAAFVKKEVESDNALPDPRPYPARPYGADKVAWAEFVMANGDDQW